MARKKYLFIKGSDDTGAFMQCLKCKYISHDMDLIKASYCLICRKPLTDALEERKQDKRSASI
jgi:hypothetical protein